MIRIVQPAAMTRFISHAVGREPHASPRINFLSM